MRVSSAFGLAKELLAERKPRRFAHIQGVGDRARQLGGNRSRSEGLLQPAALLHDIGYAPDLVQTGFHPIDGALHLRRLGVDERLVNLVAHHSCARIDAGLRGLQSLLDEQFPRDDSLPHDELCFCDMTTSPDGELVTIDERLAEIRQRYGEGSIVHDFVDLAEPELRAAVRRVMERGD
jgi:hypothetical protein